MTDRIFLGHTTEISVATITRPSNATQYTSGDVWGTAASDIITFTEVARSDGGSGMITTALAIDSANQATPPSFELWLFSVAPAAQADNVAFAPTDAELANLLGKIVFDSPAVGNAGAGAAGNLVFQSDILTMAFKAAGGTTSLYGVIVLRSAYTPVADESMTIKLACLQDY